MAENKRGLPRGEKAGRNFEDLPKEEMEEVQGAGDTEGEIVGSLTVNRTLQTVSVITPIKSTLKI